MTIYYKRSLLCVFFLTFFLLNACGIQKEAKILKTGTGQQSSGKDYPVHSASELNALKLLPGDRVILQSGEWKDQQLNFKAKGTKKQPIILTSAEPGKIILSGNSTLKIDGEWLVADGLAFANGYSENDVITFSKTSSWCRLTNTSIKNYNHPDQKKDYKWVSLYGVHNRVDHCELTGKTHQGTTLVVWLDDRPNYHEIDHNYFGPRPALGVNGGETIRIGTSTWSMHDSYTKVAFNIFDRCNGETEIVSIKSGHNTISNNLFYECDGTLTFRHGNNSEASYNYFIGNKKPNTGGIRIIGENQNVHHNYLQGLSGKGLRAAISVMNAFEKPALSDYWQVKNAIIEDNIIVNCSEAFVLGSGKNAKRIVAPDEVRIQGNYIINPGKLLTIEEEPKNLIIKNNQVQGAPLEKGFVKMGDGLVKAAGLWQLKTEQKTPFWEDQAIGPLWNPAARKFPF